MSFVIGFRGEIDEKLWDRNLIQMGLNKKQAEKVKRSCMDNLIRGCSRTVQEYHQARLNRRESFNQRKEGKRLHTVKDRLQALGIRWKKA